MSRVEGAVSPCTKHKLIFAILLRSETHVGGSLNGFALLDLGEDVAQLEGVAVVLESVRALQVEPEDLCGGVRTY